MELSVFDSKNLKKWRSAHWKNPNKSLQTTHFKNQMNHPMDDFAINVHQLSCPIHSLVEFQTHDLWV